MSEIPRTYVAIDLKSFYASVECVKRGYDPLTTNLVVADMTRTDKTICLAVTPSLKAYGISGRARAFEVIQRVREINADRLRHAPRRRFTGKSVFAPELAAHPDWELDYIAAIPQMAHYIEWSSQIYGIYLRYLSEEDIYVYSIDEVFLDVTDYLKLYRMNAHELAMTIIHDILKETGITATAGIGTNMYLCKVAMDIVAKHMPPDRDGVRIAELDEISYRTQLWDHRPLTDFWRVGPGYTRKLEALGLCTMGDIAWYSTTAHGRDHLHRLFGVNAELLIDHAWGYEPCSMRDVKSFGGERKSLGSSQVLTRPYTAEEARIVTLEMADALSLSLFKHHLCTEQLVLGISYDKSNLESPELLHRYTGEISLDHYGRMLPSHSHGTIHLSRKTASSILITNGIMELYDRIVRPELLIRRLHLSAEKVLDESKAEKPYLYEQLDLFTDPYELEKAHAREEQMLEKEKHRQSAILEIRKKYGKNAILKGTSLLDAATQKSRNEQIGGHRA